MDTRLSEILIFKLFRAEAATGTVTLYLQRVEKAFRAGIVIAAAFCTHAAPKVVLLQQGLIICFRAGIVIAAAFCTHAAPKVVLLQQGLIIC